MKKYILFVLFSLIVSIFILETNRLIVDEIKYDYITRQKAKEFIDYLKKNDLANFSSKVILNEYELQKIIPCIYIKHVHNLGHRYFFGIPGGGCYIPKEDKIVLYTGTLNYYREDWKRVFYEEYLHKKTFWILKRYYFIVAFFLLILPILSFFRCQNIRTIDKIAFSLSGFITCYYLWEWIAVIGSLIKYFSFSSLFLSIAPISIPLWVMIFYVLYSIRVINGLRDKGKTIITV